ncbi:MAG: hypothetical protein HY220_02015 [Candidatus Sungbacteria bacterium]|uniref:Uncharacterized protein n=1 Tax=Candidatus Sungiibacteriota bacterium TaxID=2750080 RepID=A0A9D6QRZ1_9BACT|nr:hypothetical protein [Candidatus Sungbacteria bacterium]
MERSEQNFIPKPYPAPISTMNDGVNDNGRRSRLTAHNLDGSVERRLDWGGVRALSEFLNDYEKNDATKPLPAQIFQDYESRNENANKKYEINGMHIS